MRPGFLICSLPFVIYRWNYLPDFGFMASDLNFIGFLFLGSCDLPFFTMRTDLPLSGAGRIADLEFEI